MKYYTILLLIICLLSTFSLPIMAEEYQMPENFAQLMDLTYDAISHSISIDSNHFYDILLMDENFMALSALTRAESTQMTLSEIKDYFKKSMIKYDQETYFLFMVMAFDLHGDTDFSNLASRISITNSTGTRISGEEVERYDSILIIQFPRKEFDRLAREDSSFTIQITGYNEQVYQTQIQHNYQEQIPTEIHELIQILLG